MAKAEKSKIQKSPVKTIRETRPAAKPVRKLQDSAPTSRARVALGPVISLQDRHRRVAEAAYFIALRKGFVNTDPQKNWIEAERQIDADLALHGIKVST